MAKYPPYGQPTFGKMQAAQNMQNVLQVAENAQRERERKAFEVSRANQHILDMEYKSRERDQTFQDDMVQKMMPTWNKEAEEFGGLGQYQLTPEGKKAYGDLQNELKAIHAMPGGSAEATRKQAAKMQEWSQRYRQARLGDKVLQMPTPDEDLQANVRTLNGQQFVKRRGDWVPIKASEQEQAPQTFEQYMADEDRREKVFAGIEKKHAAKKDEFDKPLPPLSRDEMWKISRENYEADRKYLPQPIARGQQSPSAQQPSATSPPSLSAPTTPAPASTAQSPQDMNDAKRALFPDRRTPQDESYEASILENRKQYVTDPQELADIDRQIAVHRRKAYDKQSLLAEYYGAKDPAGTSPAMPATPVVPSPGQQLASPVLNAPQATTQPTPSSTQPPAIQQARSGMNPSNPAAQAAMGYSSPAPTGGMVQPGPSVMAMIAAAKAAGVGSVQWETAKAMGWDPAKF